MEPIAGITPVSSIHRVGRPQAAPAVAPAAAIEPAAPAAAPSTALVPSRRSEPAMLQPRRVSAPFIAQLLATKAQLPQARMHRRAEPDTATGLYAAASLSGTRPAVGRVYAGEI